MWWDRCYFDKQDHELLTLVNKVVTMRAETRLGHKVFDASLHAHGIKALAMSREMRVAHAVVKLLDSLEAGQSEDRLRALRTLYDEVLNSAQTTLRRNTARVLIQVMKELVRAHGNVALQRRLAHDFRRAAQGTPRVVRALLERYHLVEMPEDWSQLSFDHHVHDANTKGRKNPTHLIMDAWIKGIRYLTVIYYNYVEQDAAREILYAAEIMGMSVRIGIELSSPFRNRYVHFIWVPRGFSDADNFMEFLSEPPMQHLMKLGREASAWQQRYVFTVLEAWNQKYRHELSAKIDLPVEALDEQDFRTFVGTGQPSLLHLAECIHQRLLPLICERVEGLHKEWKALAPEDDDGRHRIELAVAELESRAPAAIHDTWLVPEKNPNIPSPHVPTLTPETPELLRLPPLSLLDWLTSLNSGYRITLNLANLTAEDVLELLWMSEGLITHLEIFNLKEWYEGKLSHLEEINTLQQVINRGSAPRLKHIIRDMLKRYEDHCALPENTARCARLRAILRNIPTLQGFYKAVPLRTRMGTDSTSRSQKIVGMGLVFPETLTPRGQTYFRQRQAVDVDLPFHIAVRRHVRYSPSPLIPQDYLLTRLIRWLPGCANYGYTKEQEWVSHSSSARIAPHGNIAPLGGTLAQQALPRATPPHPKLKKAEVPSSFYLNTRLANVLKVLVGFIPAVCAFQYTQSWWFLAWLGPVIWFAITGFRNIIQAVMAGGGFHRSTLLRWNDHVSWTRLCDSLMYTGFSVPLLELGIRKLLLEEMMGYTVVNHEVLVYTCMSVANGLYIAWHNIMRGLPKEAVIGNLFRSALAIPVAVLYSESMVEGLLLMGVPNPLALLQPGAAIISKTASDTVAALIEGFADRKNNVRMRRWDYQTKLKQMFDTYAQLELIFPEEDALAMLAKPRQIFDMMDEKHAPLKIAIIINALDFMHFWLYQPRAQDVFKAHLRELSEEERMVLVRSQLVLVLEREVSQLFVNGMVGKDFGRALAFYLDRHEEYLRTMVRLCAPGQKLL